MSLLDIYKAKKLGVGAGSLFEAKAGGKLNKDTWKKGFNKWNEEWEVGSWNADNGQKTSRSDAIRCEDYIPITPSTDYYFLCSAHQQSHGVLIWYGESKNYLGRTLSALNVVSTSPSNAHYCTFYIANQTTYNNDVCINISGEHDGEYVPYDGE